MSREWRAAALIGGVFLLCYVLPVDQLQASPRVQGAIWESLHLSRWYAREHVVTCLVPAFFIAGAIGVFLGSGAVMRYLGPGARASLAYGVASVSGAVLAVCSCTVLPLFAGIYRMGAGLGPACTFLYAGPAINVLAIVLTLRVLGVEIGIARAVGAVLFSVVVGMAMQALHRHETPAAPVTPVTPAAQDSSRSLGQTVLYFAAMIGVLVFANWGAPDPDVTSGPWHWIHAWKWVLTAGCAVGLGLMLVRWFQAPRWLVASIALVVAGLAVAVPGVPLVPFVAGLAGLGLLTAMAGGELREWGIQSWIFARQILPLLFFGVLVAGALLGRPGHEGLLPSRYVELLVGASPEPFLAATGLAGTGLGGVLGALWPGLTCLVAAVLGAGMYFATLTEVPIVEGLRDAGMGEGPALTLLLAGPAVSLPNLLVIRGVLGTRKTLVFLLLVVVMATATGTVYGLLA